MNGATGKIGIYRVMPGAAAKGLFFRAAALCAGKKEN